MTEQEFLDKILKLDIIFYQQQDENKKPNRWCDYGNKYIIVPKKKRKQKDKSIEEYKLEELFLYKKWRTGGVTGGGYWNDENTQFRSVDGEKEPDFDDVTIILETICPEITYLKYKKLMSSLNIKREEWKESEYYGNSTNYASEIINLQDFYSTLKKLKVIE